MNLPRWLTFLLIIVGFFVVSLLQFSFFPYFNVRGFTPNLVFILFFIIIFFEEEQEYDVGFFAGLIGGAFLDVFSFNYFGPSIIFLLAIYLLLKTILHFLKERYETYLILYFIVIFSLFFMLYQNCLTLFLHTWTFSFNENTLILLAYNVFLASIGFYIYKNIKNLYPKDKQLKLFK